MADQEAVSEGTQQAEATETQEAPEYGPDRETPKSVGREAAREALKDRMGGDEQGEEGVEPEAEETPEAEAGEELQEAGDGVPTPPDQRSTEDVPEGTYREETTGRLKDAESHEYVSEPSTEETEEADEGPSVPEGFELADLPEGHPLRDRGEEALPIPSKDQLTEHFGKQGEQVYEYLRSQINNPVRSREVEQARQQARQLQNRIAELEAEQEAREEATEAFQERREEFLSDEDNLHKYQDIKQAYSEEDAEAWLKASLGTSEEDLARETKEEKLTQKQWEQKAREFQTELQQTLANAPLEEAYKGWAEKGRQHMSQRISQALAQYAQQVDQHPNVEPDVSDFVGFLDRYYVQTPGGQQHVQTYNENGNENDRQTQSSEDHESLREELKAEVLEELKGEQESEEEALAEAAARRAGNPQGRMPSAETGARTPRPEDASPDYTDMTPDKAASDRKERLKKAFGG